MTTKEEQPLLPHSSNARVRYYGLDGLRAIMMLLGLVLHAIISYMHIPLSGVWPFRDPSTHYVWTYLLLFIHIFRMPIFYIMAGFFAALLLQRRGAAAMIRNRFTRIFIPFVIGWIILKPLTDLGFDFANAVKESSITEAWSVLTSTSILDTYIDNTIHLWFLYYLLYFYLASLIIAAVTSCIPVSWHRAGLGVFEYFIKSRGRALWFAIPTTITLLFAPAGVIKTSGSFIPVPLTFITYGIFFGFGWLLYLKRELLYVFDNRAWLYVVLSLLLAPVNLVCAARGMSGISDPYGVNLYITAITGALIVWLLAFGTTGLFMRYLNRPNAVVRYIVDASYWIYLIHLPFTIWIPGLLVGLPWSSTIKIIVILSIGIPVWWASYDLLVRNTFIGMILNGRRYPRGLPEVNEVSLPAVDISTVASQPVPVPVKGDH